MKDLRIIFMGTPDFAVATLNALVEAKKNIVAVITAPDKPAGRGRKINQSAVKKYAISKELEILQPKNLKDPDFISVLKNFKSRPTDCCCLQDAAQTGLVHANIWHL